MKLAIIGASSGQLPLCLKAHELGMETHCFAWDKGAVCKDVVDHFYPISIIEKEKIVDICRELHVDGVVSNTSEITAEIASFVAEQLGLVGTPYRVLEHLQLSEHVEDLSKPSFYKYDGNDLGMYPCVIKPCEGSAKAGVSFVRDHAEFQRAIAYAQKTTKGDILVEEYIDGKELSIESLSYRGKHYVMQITDKDSSSAPHFVELGHHQPAMLPTKMKAMIENVVPKLLTVIGYTNGASHIEVKYHDDKLYLIEVNLRGGGDDISNKLVLLSSGIDYLRSMIEVALGIFKEPVQVNKPAFAGIYFLCKQTEDLIPFFERAKNKPWCVEEKIFTRELQESHSNYERNGYLIYKSDHKITPEN